MIRLLTLSLFVSVCLAELIPVSNYIGQHKSKCDRNTVLTGALVQDKIYTFGGCYPIPYVVTPSIDNMYNSGGYNHNNVSETIQIYDIKKDEWTHETEVKLPFPWRTASTQTYQQDIYFHNIHSDDHFQHSSKMWKYDTVLKEFSALGDLPFIWHGFLRTCVNNGKMYFAGTVDGRQRNIIQVYNIESGIWEKPLFPNLRFVTEQMICSENAIQFLSIMLTGEDDLYVLNNPIKVYEVIRVDYLTGEAVLSGLSATVTENYDPITKTNNGKFYNFDVKQEEKTIITVIDTVASEVTTIELPHVLVNPLFVPYQDDLLYLLGGIKRMSFHENQPVGGLKKYNHKLVLESTAKFVLQNK